MNPDESLPPELAELERRLQERNVQDDSAAMRDRVLGAVGLELLREKQVQGARLNRWSMAGIAAAVLITMNLSITTTAVTPPFHHGISRIDSNHQIELIRAAIPDLSEADANRLILYSMLAKEFPLVPNVGPIEKGTLP